MPRKPRDPTERLMEHISPEPNSGCWLWTGYCDQWGYARGSYLNRKGVHVHRVAYMLFVGPILPGLEINHKCRVKCCINPEHLEAVTRKQHIAIDDDLISAGRQKASHASATAQLARTHCRRGHPFSDSNLKIHKNGVRQCKKCISIAIAKRKAVKSGTSV